MALFILQAVFFSCQDRKPASFFDNHFPVRITRMADQVGSIENMEVAAMERVFTYAQMISRFRSVFSPDVPLG
jgi:hypothetical protein